VILPPGHAQAVAAPRRLRAREKWIVGSVLAVVAALILVTAIALAGAGRSSGHGCVDVTISSSLGGQELYGCGARARAMCAAAGAPGGYGGAAGRAIAAECRKAGVPSPAPR